MTIVETQITTPEPDTVVGPLEKEQVRRGAAFLDEVSPGWHDRINLADFDITDCSKCVVGQLFVEAADSSFGDNFEFDRVLLDYGIENYGKHYGFWAYESSNSFRSYEDDAAAWDRLGQAWRDEITSRRA